MQGHDELQSGCIRLKDSLLVELDARADSQIQTGPR